MTDEEITTILQDLLNRFYDDKTGVMNNAIRISTDEGKKKIAAQNLNLAQKKGVDAGDIRFALSGREILESRLGKNVGCVGRAKAFMELASNSGLDMQAVITTRTDNLDSGVNGHVIPAVKMSDGEYHMFDPARQDLKFLNEPARVGTNVTHVLDSLKDTPYRVMKIISRNELESIKTQEMIKNASRVVQLQHSAREM